MEIINWKQELLPFQQAVDELIVKFNSIQREFDNEKMHSPIVQVDGRVKSIASIMDKANKRNISLGSVFYELEDIAGIRIICRFVEDIEKVVVLLRERHGIDMFITKEEDYVKNFKPSGYRSYHINIKYPMVTMSGPCEVAAEIQIRTMAMNFWATIEHSLRYKYNGNIPEELKEKLQTCAVSANTLDKEMSTIRVELLEAQKIANTKNNLVNEIIKNIHNLYRYAKVEKINQFNKQFIDLYQEDNLDKLLEFNNQLEVLTQIYRVQYN